MYSFYIAYAPPTLQLHAYKTHSDISDITPLYPLITAPSQLHLMRHFYYLC